MTALARGSNMAITSVTKNVLYVNLTNHCTNRCGFCAREGSGGKNFTDIKPERESTLSEVIADLSAYNLDNFNEIVFRGCGHGEPACRLYDMLETCKMLRERTTTPIKVETNGQASMIYKEDTAVHFKGLVDTVSINLMAADADTYMKLCQPKFGEDAFIGVIKFAREVSKYVPNVILTVYRGTISDADIERCSGIASELGAGFVVRDI